MTIDEARERYADAWLYTPDFWTADLGNVVALLRKYLENHYYNAIIGDYYANDLPHFTETWLESVKWNIQYLLKTTTTEFNPLDNYDKSSTITTDYGVTSSTTTIGGDKTTSVSGATKVTQATTSITNTTENATSPMDEDTRYYPESKQTDTLGPTTITTNGDSVTDTVTTQGRTDTTQGAQHTDTVTEHTRGNIGVTTSAKMASEMFELTRDYNMYEELAKMFFNRFCIGFDVEEW